MNAQGRAIDDEDATPPAERARRFFRRFLIALLVVALACLAYRYWIVASVFGGRETLELIEGADRIDAYRIESGDRADGKASFGPYTVTSGPLPVGEEDAAALKKVLASTLAYPPINTECEVKPAVRIRFARGKSAEDVLFCFACSSIVVYEGDQARAPSQFSKSARRALVRTMKHIFPSDAKIRSLAEDVMKQKPLGGNL